MSYTIPIQELPLSTVEAAELVNPAPRAAKRVRSPALGAAAGVAPGAKDGAEARAESVAEVDAAEVHSVLSREGCFELPHGLPEAWASWPVFGFTER